MTNLSKEEDFEEIQRGILQISHDCFFMYTNCECMAYLLPFSKAIQTKGYLFFLNIFLESSRKTFHTKIKVSEGS